ncbi:sialidase family protein [Devosia faecipullorum]|uniref:sialidase family protein n=1 Tax=Devosia faecipullorum TaxID=2755039 RepID=UPI00187B3946|nr:sialidase family protein [Devosia faecipullorum]MBE7731474.1 exo-alpha-sialidase [Devosia faecipullorum]
MVKDRRALSNLFVLALLATMAAPIPAFADGEWCMECVSVRVGPPQVVRGPFPDEIDAPFSAVRLPDGTFRGFSANGHTYAIEGTSLSDMAGPRHSVLEEGDPGSLAECGRWLTSTIRSGAALLGMVHQERICDYGPDGQTDKSMAIALSRDDGLNWTDLGTVISGQDAPQRGRTTGEGDCTMLDGGDGYLYAYCLRNSDWQTIAARAPLSDPLDWRKYHDGAWDEPGLGGKASAIGFVGPGAGLLLEQKLVVTVTPDPWFAGVRLSFSTDKVTFTDFLAPLLVIDGSDWERPADTELVAYANVLNPADGGNEIDQNFVLSYLYVPAGKDFADRYLVLHDVTLSIHASPPPAPAGIALTRWSNAERSSYVSSTGPLTGDRADFQADGIIAYMLTQAPADIASIRFAECGRDIGGRLDHLLADEGSCKRLGYKRERTAGWLFALEQSGTSPVYRCQDNASGAHFVSAQADCEGLGSMQALLGYGLKP